MHGGWGKILGFRKIEGVMEEGQRVLPDEGAGVCVVWCVCVFVFVLVSVCVSCVFVSGCAFVRVCVFLCVFVCS